MKLLFPISAHTTFYLKQAGYECGFKPQSWKDVYMGVFPLSKTYGYSHNNKEYKSHPNYIPKVLMDTTLLDQIPLLVALGLSEKEIIEILRS